MTITRTHVLKVNLCQVSSSGRSIPEQQVLQIYAQVYSYVEVHVRLHLHPSSHVPPFLVRGSVHLTTSEFGSILHVQASSSHFEDTALHRPDPSFILHPLQLHTISHFHRIKIIK